jgi:hypothetical protein
MDMMKACMHIYTCQVSLGKFSKLNWTVKHRIYIFLACYICFPSSPTYGLQNMECWLLRNKQGVSVPLVSLKRNQNVEDTIILTHVQWGLLD